MTKTEALTSIAQVLLRYRLRGNDPEASHIATAVDDIAKVLPEFKDWPTQVAAMSELSRRLNVPMSRERNGVIRQHFCG